MITKKDIISDRENDKKRFKITKDSISYDTALVGSWEASLKSSQATLDKYNQKIKENKYMSSDDLKAYKGAVDSYVDNASRLNTIYKTFGNAYTDKNERDWMSNLSSMKSGYDELFKFYSQFDSEESYNSWANIQKDINDVIKSKDFEQYSSVGESKKEREKWYTGIDNYVAHLRDPDNLATYESSAKGANGASFGTVKNTLLDKLEYKAAKYMTDDEYKVYNYYVGKGDTKKAEEFLKALEPTLTQKQASEIVGDVKGNALKTAFFAVESGLDQFWSGIGNLDNFIMGTEGDTPSAIQMASPEIRKDVKGVLGVGYDLAQTTANMLPSILVGTVTGGVGGAITMGAGATGNAYSEMRTLGYDEWQSRGYAALVGASETVLSSVLGGISKLGGGGKGIFQTVASKIVPKLDNAIARVAIDLGGNMLDEGLEEAIQEVLDPIFKGAMTGEKIEWASIEDVLYSGLLGVLSAGLLEGAPTIAGTVINSKIAKNEYGDNVQGVINEAIRFDPENAHAQRMQTRLDEGRDISGYQINRLNEAIQEGKNKIVEEAKVKDREAVKSALKSRLVQLGETSDAEALAEAFTKKEMGERLGLREEVLIANSDFGQRILNETNPANMDSGMYSTAWSEKLAKDRAGISVEEYKKLINVDQNDDEKAEISPDETIEANTAETVAKVENKADAVKIDDVVEKNQSSAKKIDSTETTKADINAETTINEEVAVAKDTTTTPEGKTIITKTLEEVTPVRIASTEGGMKVELDNGNVVEASKLTFGSPSMAIAYDMVEWMGVPAKTANALVNEFKSINDLDTESVARAYQYGKIGYKEGLNSVNLTEVQKQRVYDLGRADAQAEIDAKQEKVTSNAKTRKGSGQVHFEKGAKAVTSAQKKAVNLAKHIAKAIGIDIVFYDATIEGTYGSDSNGYFDEKTNTIHLDLQNAHNDAKTIVFTMSHELVHFIKKWSPSKFKVFADFLLENYATHAESSTLLKNKMAELGTTDVDFAYEEMIADSCETMLLDSNAVVKLMELRKTDLTLFEKIKKHILELLNKIRAEYKKRGLEPTSEEAKALLRMEDVLGKLHEMFEAAAQDAAQNYQAARNQPTENSNETDGIRKQVKRKNKITIGMTDTERSEILKSKKLVSPVYEGQADEIISVNKKDLESQKLGLVKAALVKVGEEFDVFTDYDIKDVEVKITLSKSNLKESISKDASPVQLAKLLPLLKDAVGNAIGIESHSNRYYYDTDTVYFDNLLGGYVDGKEFVPVRFGLKHSHVGTTTLYVVVDQNKISLDDFEKTKNDRGLQDASPDLTESNNLHRSVSYSISQIIPFVNSKDLLRYLPDDMLNAQQKQTKWEGIAETIKRTNEKNDLKYTEYISKGNLDAAKQMVSAAARANGYTVKAYHGTNANFTVFEKSKIGSATDDGIYGKGFYFSRYYAQASQYNKDGIPMTVFLKIQKPLILNDFQTAEELGDKLDIWEGVFRKNSMGVFQPSISRIDQFTSHVIYAGYDAVEAYYSRADEIVVFNPNQVKSADTITYDSDGNIVPLSERFNSENPDIRYQKKRPTNRSLLANALESVAQDDTERKRLAEYKENIALLDAEQEKLAKVSAKLRELSFAKGKRDQAAIDRLKETKNKIANRINLYDRKLLKLEATKSLKDVLERATEAARKKEAQKGREALAEYRENVNKRAVRAKIKNFKSKMESMLQRPTDRQYVPMGLASAIIDVCELINTDTDLYKKDGSINKAQAKREDTKEKLRDLKDEYEKLKSHSDPMYSGEFDDAVYDYLTELQENYGGRNLNDMSIGELQDMYEMLRAIDETLADARKLIGFGDAIGVYEAGDAIVAEQDKITEDKRKNGHRNAAQKARDKTLNYTLSPVRNVERMSDYNENSFLLKLFKNFEKGVRKKNMFVMESYKLFEDITTGKNAKAYEDALYTEYKGKKFTDVNGRKFGVSKMQMMQAILSYEREKANEMNHINGSGFSFADLDMLQKGKLREAISEEHSHRVPSASAMVEGFIEELRGDKWAQEYMAVARRFFNEKAKDAVNETSLALKHRIIAKDKNYIPFEVDKNFVVREISAQNDIQQTINSYGMLKETKSGASQPLIITGLNNVLDRHIDQVGNVYGLAIEVRNFNKVWSARSIDIQGNDPTVKAAIQRNWGAEGVKHIEQAVQDIQGPRVSNQSALYSKIKSNYIGATFLLNLSVVTKQIGSLFTSTSMLRYRNPVRMLGNLVYTMLNYKTISAEVDKYTATAWTRRQGVSDSELQTLMTEGKKSFIGKYASKAPAIINPFKWIAGMDSAVALSLWRYAKQDTAKKTGLKGEELLKATAEFYDEVVENTQSMTDVLHRPEVQKNGNIASDAFGMFKTDLYQMAGQLQVSAGRFMANKSKENAKALGRTAYSIVMSAVWAQLMTTVFALLRYKVNQYRDDEDEELTAESWLKRQSFSLAGDLLGYMFPLLGGELVGTIESFAYGEEPDVADNIVLTAADTLFDTVGDVASSIKEGEMPSVDDCQKLIVQALQMAGVPANNISRLVSAINLHIEDIKNGEFLSFEAGVERTYSQHVNRIAKAMASGKTDVAMGLYEDAVEELAQRKAVIDEREVTEEDIDDVKSSLKTAIGKKYKDGEVSRKTTEKLLRELFEMDEEEARDKVDYWAFKRDNPKGYDGLVESTYTKYKKKLAPHGVELGDFYDAYMYRKEINADESLTSKQQERKIRDYIYTMDIPTEHKRQLIKYWF